MASWRAPGSILEAPGSISEAPSLDFGGSELDFWGAQTSVSKVLGVIFGTANAKNAQKSAKTKTPSRSGQTAIRWVAGGGPPRAASIRIATNSYAKTNTNTNTQTQTQTRTHTHRHTQANAQIHTHNTRMYAPPPPAETDKHRQTARQTCFK